jgi:hypothetical protein
MEVLYLLLGWQYNCQRSEKHSVDNKKIKLPHWGEPTNFCGMLQRATEKESDSHSK